MAPQDCAGADFILSFPTGSYCVTIFLLEPTLRTTCLRLCQTLAPLNFTQARFDRNKQSQICLPFCTKPHPSVGQPVSTGFDNDYGETNRRDSKKSLFRAIASKLSSRARCATLDQLHNTINTARASSNRHHDRLVFSRRVCHPHVHSNTCFKTDFTV